MGVATFAPGFQISSRDVAILCLAAIGSVALASVAWWCGFVVAFVFGHFFLFCNVFRIARRLELVWSGIFVAFASGTIAFDMPGWGTTIGVSLAAAIAVVAMEMRKPSYHGVAWHRINPDLRAWWDTHRGEDSCKPL